jgi:hypothetical protein
MPVIDSAENLESRHRSLWLGAACGALLKLASGDSIVGYVISDISEVRISRG